MKAVLRRMRVEDLDAIMAIETRVFPDSWSRQNFEFEVLTNRLSLPVVLEDQEGQIIGYAVAWLLFEEFHIATIAIHPDYQGRGLGRYLLQKLLEMAREQEYALLEVRPSNRRAIRLYESFGFRAIGRRKRYYRNGEDAIIMRKELKPPTA